MSLHLVIVCALFLTQARVSFSTPAGCSPGSKCEQFQIYMETAFAQLVSSGDTSIQNCSGQTDTDYTSLIWSCAMSATFNSDIDKGKLQKCKDDCHADPGIAGNESLQANCYKTCVPGNLEVYCVDDRNPDCKIYFVDLATALDRTFCKDSEGYWVQNCHSKMVYHDDYKKVAADCLVNCDTVNKTLIDGCIEGTHENKDGLKKNCLGQTQFEGTCYQDCFHDGSSGARYSSADTFSDGSSSNRTHDNHDSTPAPTDKPSSAISLGTTSMFIVLVSATNFVSHHF